MSLFQRAKKFFAGPDKKAARERRKLKRIACHQEFICTRAGEAFPVVVVDVGFGGFRVTSKQSLGKRGDILHLRRVATDFQRHLTGAYTTGLMVRVAWVKELEGSFEAGLYLPEAPGTMRISWFKELLKELGFDEKAVFSKRSTRRFRCRLPGELTCGPLPGGSGTVLDLSPGGGLFGAGKAAPMGVKASLHVRWGEEELELPVTVLGVRANALESQGGRWLHSLRFEENLSKRQERILYAWLEELAKND